MPHKKARRAPPAKTVDLPAFSEAWTPDTLFHPAASREEKREREARKAGRVRAGRT